MEIITSITDQPKQKFVLTLENNESVDFYLYYSMSQFAWYFDFQYKDYVCNGNKVVLTMNALRHLRNKIPFGISFVSGGEADPFDLNDFANGNVLMILLNKTDVLNIESAEYDN